MEYYKGSVTHVAAALVGGNTLTHMRMRLRNKKQIWIILDEANFTSATQWCWLARFQFVGCKFLICGDFAGQFLPITSQYESFDYDALEFSDFMHGLCKGLRIDLTSYFRGNDKAHHEFVKSLYPGRSRDLSLPCLLYTSPSPRDRG